MKRIPRPPKHVLEQMYLVDNKSSIELGKLYGVATCTILGWLRYHAIEVRPPGRALVANMTRKQQMKHDRKRSVCKTLEKHAHDLSDDPERLSTEFMQGLIGVQCD